MTIIPFLNNVNRLILNPIILLMFGLATVYLIYGIVKFLSLEPGDKARDEAKSAIIWGIVGMVVMVSVYGIIQFVLSTFGISNNDLPANAEQFLR